MNNYPDLPDDFIIEIEIRIMRKSELLRTIIGQLDNENLPIKFKPAGLGVQSMSYELLKAVWNKSIQPIDTTH